jgi:hypothetical protein
MASSSVFVNSAKPVIAISDDQLAVLLVSGKQQGRQFLAADDLSLILFHMTVADSEQ